MVYNQLSISTLVLFFLLLCISLPAMDKDKYDHVISLIQKNNYTESYEIISSLRNTSTDDPEYYALILNYYYSKSVKDIISVKVGEPTKEEYFQLYDSTFHPVGVVESDTKINIDTLYKGLNEFEIGLNKFENRLDLHFGLIYVAYVTGQYHLMLQKMLNAIQISKKLNNKWLWSFNKPYTEQGEKAFLESIQDGIYSLSEKNTPQTDSIIVEVSNSLVKEYPKCIYGYNNLGTVFFMNNRLDKARQYFEIAYKLDETDVIVLKNLASINTKLNLKDEAVKYYEKIIEFADDETIIWAKEQIKTLHTGSN
jgi:tetratricopeptide (TPR) repeat protein